ncbi:ribosomal RNA-processing protein 8 isoform X2 [Girardinichthys multiradiatus]|uniref:ribosomal RNA-processing protein 8 isoform X2 n=1 Tax=Girardinichthys multiradiatus TaxID=208333 RepID=UPI001FAC6BBD|nr:ribosomal RNA-processing protein 8 isoform X2 [Girardinichthys multiradiatus]
MFNEDEDWSDEQEGKILSKTVFKNTQKADSSTHLKSNVTGKKSLLRTLKTLGSAPEWKSSDHEQDSDSETEVPSSPSKKKKRRKRRKHEGQSEEQQEGASKAHKTSAGEMESDKVPEPPQEIVNKEQGDEKLSRKQWKNKMKNKKRCKNKFRHNKHENDANKVKTTDKQEQAKKIKIDPHNSNSENISQTANQKHKQEKETKTVKRKTTEQEADRFTTATGKKQQKVEKVKSGESAESPSKDSAEGLKHKAEELQVGITHDLQQFPTKRQKPELSKEQSLKRERLQKILRSQEKDDDKSPVEKTDTPAVQEEVKQSSSDSLRSRMEQRLEAARFRYINELLYSTSSGEARRMFQQDPQAFWVYHKGYTTQVQRWPANPVDAIISYIQKKPPTLVVADFGCGDCKIASSVKNKVHSFDLAATCELVTVCDMAKVPLGDGSVDIAVFCLSLMGTNLAEFLAEANRVLKMRGVLKIAEVASRFENVQNFISALAGLGFKMTSKDTENSHFFSFEFVKTGNVPKIVKKFGLQLKPCVYKKR